MRRVDRLFQIVQHLRSGRLVTARALADRLEVSVRTVYRDVADLQATGVPIEGEAGVGHVMREGFDLPPLMFTSAKIVALVAGARIVRAWGGSAMALAAEEALVKIEAVLPEGARAKARTVPVHAASRDMDEALRARIDKIEAAVEARQRLVMAYRDAEGIETDRTLRPLGLWFWGSVWTLVAWCERRRDFRMFRLDRISAMALADRFPPERDKTLSVFFRRMEDEACDLGARPHRL